MKYRACEPARGRLIAILQKKKLLKLVCDSSVTVDFFLTIFKSVAIYKRPVVNGNFGSFQTHCVIIFFPVFFIRSGDGCQTTNWKVDAGLNHLESFYALILF